MEPLPPAATPGRPRIAVTVTSVTIVAFIAIIAFVRSDLWRSTVDRDSTQNSKSDASGHDRATLLPVAVPRDGADADQAAPVRNEVGGQLVDAAEKLAEDDFHGRSSPEMSRQPLPVIPEKEPISVAALVKQAKQLERTGQWNEARKVYERLPGPVGACAGGVGSPSSATAIASVLEIAAPLSTHAAIKQQEPATIRA